MDAQLPAQRRQDESCESSGPISPASPTLEKDLADNLRLLSLVESTAEENDPIRANTSHLNAAAGELHGMLSLHSIITTASFNAADRMAAQAGETSKVKPFKKIGAGACGVIFAKAGESTIFKLARTKDDRALWNDYRMHTLIEEHFKKCPIADVCIPDCSCFFLNDEEFYDSNPGLVEEADPFCHLPASALIAERILPLPKPIRNSLIEKYCPPRIKEKAFNDPANKDCLVRVYLGSSRGKTGGLFFSLRNFKLHLNQILELQLDVSTLAHKMASAMAVMHWSARTDARDVEFVLGCSPEKTTTKVSSHDLMNQEDPITTGTRTKVYENFYQRTTKLWILDFNQVCRITMDEAGVAQAVEAAIINDPYIPRPLQTSAVEKRLWNSYVAAYLEASDKILGDEEKMRTLPRMFIRGLIDASKRKKEQMQDK